MKCPCCPDSTLSMMAREGVEIDYCPACRGIWLDRGELDKLLEMAAPAYPADSREADMPNSGRYNGDWRAPRRHDDDRYAKGRNPGRKSWLNNIFD